MSETQNRVAEIVTFRLADGSDPVAFIAAARGIEPMLRATGSALHRTLSCDENGLWTDHILWTDLAAAESAAAQIMSDPIAAPFGAMIDASSVEMRHAPVRLQME